MRRGTRLAEERIGPPDLCRLTASPSGNSRCATLWLTITTGSLSRAVVVGEVAPGEERHADDGEESGRDDPQSRVRIVLAVRRRVASSIAK